MGWSITNYNSETMGSGTYPDYTYDFYSGSETTITFKTSNLHSYIGNKYGPFVFRIYDNGDKIFEYNGTIKSEGPSNMSGVSLTLVVDRDYYLTFSFASTS